VQSKHFHRWPCAQRISLAYLNQYSEEELEQLIEDYWTTLFDMRATMLEFEQLDQTLVQIINLGRTGVLPVDLPEPIPIRRGYQPVHEGHVFYQPEAHDLLLPKQ
jgi:hypothetical protein